MINEDIRHIVEAELREGEKLLWAETTSQTRKEEHAEFIRQDNKLQSRINLVGYSVILIFVVINASARIYSIPLLVIFSVFCYITLRAGDAELNDMKNSDLGGYALSNLRLFILNNEYRIVVQKEASKLKKVAEETRHIRLNPIGSGLLKTYNLQFLPNNYSTTTYIKSVIGNTP